jgi:tRNA (guanine-N7-)-methyltransferase
VTERKRGQLYGRRKGPALSAHQSGLLETLLPELSLNIEAGRDPRDYFDTPVNDVWLEIGFGAGEHIHWQAEHNPNIGMIGAEPFVNGVAKLLSKLSLSPGTGGEGRGEGVSKASEAFTAPSPLPSPPQRGRGNLKIHMGDAREIIEALPDASLGRVFILFPDPWPKTRHHKRRIVQPELLAELARVLQRGGRLRFATDWADYADWTLERVLKSGLFAWPAERADDWRRPPADHVTTRYEEKRLGDCAPVFLDFVRS